MNTIVTKLRIHNLGNFGFLKRYEFGLIRVQGPVKNWPYILLGPTKMKLIPDIIQSV